MTLVSVLITTYHRPELLRGAIESALNQTHDEIEIIVVNDDKSDIETKKVVDNFDTKLLTAVHNDKNIGISASRNKAANIASGEFLCILDDDDRWKPEKIELQLDKFAQAGENCAVVYTGGTKWGGKDRNRIVSENSPSAARQGDVWPEILADWGMGPHSSHMIKRDAFDSVGGFDENLEHGEDWDLSIRLAKKYEFAAINAPLTIRYQHNNNIGKGVHHTDIQRKDILTKYTNEILSDENVYHNFFSKWHRHRGMTLLRSGEWFSAIREHWLSIGHSLDTQGLFHFVIAFLGPYIFNKLSCLSHFLKTLRHEIQIYRNE